MVPWAIDTMSWIEQCFHVLYNIHLPWHVLNDNVSACQTYIGMDQLGKVGRFFLMHYLAFSHTQLLSTTYSMHSLVCLFPRLSLLRLHQGPQQSRHHYLSQRTMIHRDPRGHVNQNEALMVMKQHSRFPTMSYCVYCDWLWAEWLCGGGQGGSVKGQ